MVKEILTPAPDQLVSEFSPRPVGFSRIPRHKNKLVWSSFRDQPEVLEQIIEEEARIFLDEYGHLSQLAIARAGRPDLRRAISGFYPGNFTAIRERLGITGRLEVDDSRQIVNPEDGIPKDKNGKIVWRVLIKDLPAFKTAAETMAQDLLKDGCQFTQAEIHERKLTGFEAIVRAHYPGGIRAIKEFLGFELTKPFDYWKNPENIKTELREIIASLGHFPTQRELADLKAGPLAGAISKSGGFNYWREQFGFAVVKKDLRNWKIPENIETDARKAVEMGSNLSQKSLEQLGFSSLSYAIRKFYPGGIAHLRKSLGIRESRKPNGYWRDPENVEAEARKAIQAGSNLSQKSLIELSMVSLSDAIRETYPGGASSLRKKLKVAALEHKPNGYWTPEQIEKEARLFYQEHGGLTQKIMKDLDRQDLSGAITAKYPGGLAKLKQNLGIESKYKPHGYWTAENIRKEAQAFLDEFTAIDHSLLKKHGRKNLSSAINRYYSGRMLQLQKDLGLRSLVDPSVEEIVAEAKSFLAQYGQITQSELLKRGRGDLMAYIYNRYPGGLLQLKLDTGIESKRKPRGYWTPEKIEEAARDFLEKEGGLSQTLFKERGRSDLFSVIRRFYPGGINSLLENLDLRVNQRGKGYYTPEQIRKDASIVLQREGKISNDILGRIGMTGLASGIAQYYPGRMRQLKIDLGLVVKEKPVGYWTPEIIEQEALEFYRKFGVLSQSSMVKEGRQDLSGAIGAHYPGRLTALKEKLGFNYDLDFATSPDHANEQLTKLVEVTR